MHQSAFRYYDTAQQMRGAVRQLAWMPGWQKTG
jgi:hypothetical protein